MPLVRKDASSAKDLGSQIDAFVTPVMPVAPQKALPDLREPAVGAVGEPQELWLGAHLPQLSAHRKDEPRDERRRHQVLERLAMNAHRFTPRVSVAPPDGLLLEVKGSLHLFGGVASLYCALEAMLRCAGLDSTLALTPTPLAALACARAGKTSVVMVRAQLVGQVTPLPLAVLRWSGKILERLAKIGVYTVGQALRLPRAGFARRFGVAQLASLDRLTGRVADPQAPFHPRERFSRRRDFTFEIENQALIVKLLEPLLRELEKFLQARDCGITWLECRLRHRHAPPTLCLLKLAAPAADAQRMSAVLGEKLLALVLPEPVRSCELRTGLIVPRAPASSSIWQAGERGGESGGESSQLVEHLRARLGDQAVYGLQLVPGHGPEKEWRSVDPGTPVVTGQTSRSAFRRPLWLLPIPQRLDEQAGRPRYRGPLRVFSNRECIETDETDGVMDIMRDYYVAFDIHGVRLWIFRERTKPHRWFLHGMFG